MGPIMRIVSKHLQDAVFHRGYKSQGGIMVTKKLKKSSKTKRSRKPVEPDAEAERATSKVGPWADIYQTNIAKGNLGTLEGETSGLAHQLRNRRTG